jgi:hypothetical protein
MLKKIILVILVLQVSACTELQQVLEGTGNVGLNSFQIANGLKEALQNGVANQVTSLSLENGFYNNNLVKIKLPTELKKVDQALRDIGLSNLADKGQMLLNKAAEDAVGEAIPIFRNAIIDMSITDAKNILMGEQDAATKYLQNSSSATLRAKFNPIIKTSFQKVGADSVWKDLITAYNKIPFITKVNPDLTEYTTDQALKGVFTMVAIEEKKIRTNIKSRTSDLLRKVFALQDAK